MLSLSIVGMLGLFLVVYLLYPEQLSNSLYPSLLLLGILSGCGIAIFSVGISQVSYWFPQARQGWALGTYAGIGNIAPGLSSFLIPIALVSWGLAGSYLAWLIFLVVGTALYYLIGHDAHCFQLMAQGVPLERAKEVARQYGQELFPIGSLTKSLALSIRIWKTWLLVALYFTTFGGFIALTAWLHIYWKSFFGVSTFTAGSLTALYAILTSAIRVFGGSISDRIGGENTALLALFVMLVGSILMTLSHNYHLAIGAEIVLALGMGVNNAAVFKLVPQEVPEAVGGTAGWVGGLGAFGGFAIPPIMGAFVRSQGKEGYANGFVVFVILALLSLVLAYVLKRRCIVQTRVVVSQREIR